MSKDPAILFYTSDFLTGTATMTNEEIGMYIRLLCLQHQKYRLSEKDMLFICQRHNEDIFSKFKQDEDGYYFNTRMREECEKRAKYSESRRNNRKKKENNGDMNNISKTYVQHMENENENENEIKNKKRVVREKKKFVPPEKSEVIQYFTANGFPPSLAERFFNSYSVADWKDSKGNPVLNWKQKAINVWFKDENKENGTQKNIRGITGQTLRGVEFGEF